MSDIYVVSQGKSIATKAGVKGEGATVNKQLIGKNFEQLIEKGIICKKEDLKKIETIETPAVKENIDLSSKDEPAKEDEKIETEVKTETKKIVIGATKK